MSQSARIQSYIRENARWISEAIATPPFTLFLRGGDNSPGITFAIPDYPIAEGDRATNDQAAVGQAAEVKRSLHQIEEICAQRQCKAHFRFLRAFAPELATLLQSVGYAESDGWPLLICTPETFMPAAPVAGLEMVLVTHDSPIEEIKEALDANAMGFDLLATAATGEEAEEFRPNLKGALAFLARLEGRAVAGGMVNPIREGVTEMVGIATLAPFRRRGIATYLTAVATQAAFDHGVEVAFLVPENEGAQRIYERIGYRYFSDLVICQATATET
jgi:ribosomal protein S18 acetylase RimI-like enzyme